MSKKYFERLKDLFEDITNILVKTDKENFYMSNKSITFKFPVKYKREILSNFEGDYDVMDYELETFELQEFYMTCKDGTLGTIVFPMKLDKENKNFKIIEDLFQDTYLTPAIPTSIANMSDVTTMIFYTEDGLLQVSINHINLVLEIMKQFSTTSEIKEYVSRKNHYLHLKNNEVEAIIVPEKSSQIKKELFAKDFLI